MPDFSRPKRRGPTLFALALITLAGLAFLMAVMVQGPTVQTVEDDAEGAPWPFTVAEPEDGHDERIFPAFLPESGVWFEGRQQMSPRLVPMFSTCPAGRDGTDAAEAEKSAV
jgi:hypothetical protein